MASSVDTSHIHPVTVLVTTFGSLAALAILILFAVGHGVQKSGHGSIVFPGQVVLPACMKFFGTSYTSSATQLVADFYTKSAPGPIGMCSEPLHGNLTLADGGFLYPGAACPTGSVQAGTITSKYVQSGSAVVCRNTAPGPPPSSVLLLGNKVKCPSGMTQAAIIDPSAVMKTPGVQIPFGFTLCSQPKADLSGTHAMKVGLHPEVAQHVGAAAAASTGLHHGSKGTKNPITHGIQTNNGKAAK
jgi:hypothetical protein